MWRFSLEYSSISKIHDDLIKVAFERILHDISTKIDKKKPVCFLGYCWESSLNVSVVRKIEEYLKLAGIKTLIDIADAHSSISKHINKIDTDEVDFVVYAMSECLMKRLNSDKEGTGIKEEIPRVIKKAKKRPSSVIPLLLDGDMRLSIPAELRDIAYVDFRDKKQLYLNVLHILKRVLPFIPLSGIIANFKKECIAIKKLTQSSHPRLWKKLEKIKRTEEKYTQEIQKKTIGILAKQVRSTGRMSAASIVMLTSLFIIVLGCTTTMLSMWYFDTNNFSSDVEIIRSDLHVPNQETSLARSEIYKTIDEKLNTGSGIQTVALVGAGGAGKTTIARTYLSEQSASLIWEIKAESKTSFLGSFVNLAYALATNQEDGDHLNLIEKIDNAKVRRKKILLFVQSKLRKCKNWYLLFDNIGSFEEIKYHFPYESKTWGDGKVIITSRNNNLQNSCFLENDKIIRIHHLTEVEKLALLKKIIGKKKYEKDKIEELISFVENIPPYPLDISIAGNYITESKISLKKYLEYMHISSEEFLASQERILCDIGNYRKTRHAIVLLSIDRILKCNQDFKDLLLLISLLNSQDIPRELLEKVKSPIVVDTFIHELNKHSLVELPSAKSNDFRKFSIHKRIQQIALSHLERRFTVKHFREPVRKLSSSINGATLHAIENEDIAKIRQLRGHFQELLKHKKVLSDADLAGLTEKLGKIYIYINKFKRAKTVLLESLSIHKRLFGANHIKTASVLTNLGEVYLHMGQAGKAIETIKNSLKITEQTYGKEDVRFAKVALRLDSPYRLFSDSLSAFKYGNMGYQILKKHHGEDHIDTAYAAVKLGHIHKNLGEFEKALELLKKGSSVLEKTYGPRHIRTAWSYIRLGNLYEVLGYYERANELLQKSYDIYSKHYGNHHSCTAWVLAYLGEISDKLGNHEEAKTYLEASFAIYKKIYNEKHIKSSWVLRYLGNTYKHLGDVEKAENLLTQALKVYLAEDGNIFDVTKLHIKLGLCLIESHKFEQAEQHLLASEAILKNEKHYTYYRPLEALSDLYKKKSEIALKNGDKIESYKFYNKSIKYLEDALTCSQDRFPSGTPVIQEIEVKLEKLKLDLRKA